MTAAPTGFEAELVPLLDRAYGLAYSLTHDRANAEDLVQEAALLALRAFAQFQPGTNFKAWFYKILVNAFYGQLRKQRRQGETVDLETLPSLYLYGKTAELGLQDHTDDPASALLSRLDAESIVAALEALPEEYRVACSLYFIQDFSYEDIAQTLAVPLGTVRSRIHRGRKLLQQRLWAIAEERGIVRQLKAQATA
ncbi:MAG TPA: sigma-70 family RNA polymerase sigma factor [Gemmatimonadales bacterium]|nr:sigma-70 family RNA polymerase sigma factor [Gemmatimonadales bacterium]